MNTRILKGVTAGLLSAAMLSACGGGGGSSTPPVPTGGTQSKTTTVKLTFGVSAKKTSVSRSKVKRARNTPPNGISPSTVALGISIVAHGAAFPSLRTPQFAANISAGVSANAVDCSPANPDGSYDCTVLIAAPVGYDDIQIGGWDGAVDAAPGAGFGGTFSNGQNLVAYGIGSNQLIQLNQNNGVNVPVGGIVYSAAIVVSPNSLVAGAATGSATNPTSPTVTVLASDIDGNLITGANQYYDANGTPTTLTVTEAPQALSGFSQVGTTDFGASATTAAFNTPQDSATITYDGNPISSTTLTLSATAGTPAGTFANGTLSFTKSTGGVPIPGTPVVTEFSALGAATFLPSQTTIPGITTGPDGNIWYVEQNQQPSPQVVKMTPAGVTTAYITPTMPINVTAGADGYVWYSTATTNIGKIDPSTGHVTEYSGLSYPSSRIITGPDGAIYGVEYGAGKVFRMDASGSVSEWNVSSNGPTDLAVGSDGNIYIAINGIDHVAQLPFPLPPSGTSLTENAVSGATGNTYNSIVSGTDGNMWLLESGVGGGGNSMIVSFAPNAYPSSISEYTVSTARQYQYLVQGPDSNFYMTQGGIAPGNYIARVATNGSALEFNSGVNANAYSVWLTVGPSPVAPYTANSAVWFAESGNNGSPTTAKIGAIQP